MQQFEHIELLLIRNALNSRHALESIIISRSMALVMQQEIWQLQEKSKGEILILKFLG